MRELIIICEDSFGLDILEIAESVLDYRKVHYPDHIFKIKGFIGPVTVKEICQTSSYPYLGTIENWEPKQNENFAMGILDPDHKKAAAELMKAKGAQFMILRAPGVLAPLTMKFGEGSIIAAQSIKENAEIGPFTTLFHCMVANAKVAPYSSLMGWSNVTNANIGEGAFVSDNAAVMMDITIGDHAYVAPNSIVVKNVKPNTKVSGIPARKVKD